MRVLWGWWAAALVLGMLLVDCDKQRDSGARAGAAASASASASPSPSVVSEARTTAVAIRQLFPMACAANDASWRLATCLDTAKGFDPLLACTTAARDQAKAVSAQLPPAKAYADTSCGGTVEAKSRAFVTLTVVYLDDLATWLASHRAKLVGPLRSKSFQDLDADQLKGMPHEYDEKYGGDAEKGESLRFGWVNDLACTKSLFRCGTEDDPCGARAAAVRLGVDCGTSSPYHHANDKPYCIGAICDLNNPRTWLYERSTGERIQ